MSDRYAEYERACAEVRQQNAALLSEFDDWLAATGLSRKTINGHLQNMEFYLNEYLLYEDATPAADGCVSAGRFLGYWFIRKAGWASAATIRSSASSLKKFYSFLREKGLVDAESVQQLYEEIKEEMPDWLATLERYDDPDITDSAEIWGL